MKNLVLSLLLLLGALSIQAQGDKLSIKVVDIQQKPLENIYIVAPQVFDGELFTNEQGMLVLPTTSTESFNVYDDVQLDLHSNEYTIAATQSPEIRVDVRKNQAYVSVMGRKKGSVTIVMEVKEQIVPITDARLTPEVVERIAVQIACMKNESAATEQYFESQLNMEVSKHYKGGRVIYAIDATTPDEALALQKTINAQKIKGIDHAFIVAIEKAEKREVYRLQVAASYEPLALSVREVLNSKLYKAKTAMTEYIAPNEKFTFKYLTTEFYKDEASATAAAKKLEKFGIKAFVVSYALNSLRE
jgi:hypothetical protein